MIFKREQEGFTYRPKFIGKFLISMVLVPIAVVFLVIGGTVFIIVIIFSISYELVRGLLE